MGQPLSGPLLVLGAAEKNCLEKLEQTVTRSGPEDTHTHTSVHSSLARSGVTGGQEGQSCRVPEGRETAY